MVLIAAAAAWAEDTAPSREVVVYGELLVEQARQALVAQLEQQGYTRVIEKDDRVIYRHEAGYMGEVVLYDDGWTYVKRQPLNAVAPEMPWADEGSPLAVAGCVIYPWLCVRAGGLMFGKRKWRGQETETVDGIHVEARILAERTADLAVDRTIEELPARLEALWTEGRPLDGGETLVAAADRRAALVAYWESRTDTPWGREVQEAVAAFVRGVVQHSESPFDEAELARFEVGRTD